MTTYPYPKKSVSSGHIIWAYDNALFELAAEGRSVSEIQYVLRDECSLNVGRDAILSVIGGMSRGVSNQEGRPDDA